MKAGTTTLMEYLVQHEEVSIPDYEVHFFNNDTNFNKGIEWYSQHFDRSGDVKVVGEKTPTYSYDPKVPERIYNLNPDIKLIWLFRDPVKRTYSNYIHCLMKGVEKLSFEEAIEYEEDRIKKNIFKGYCKRSIYIEQVRRYLKYFPLEQMYFIIFEEFINNPQRELNGLYEFLGVSNEGYFEEKEKNLRANKSYKPYFINLQYYSREFFGEGMIHKLVRGFNRLISSPPPPIEKQTESYLLNYFNDFNKNLAELTGVDVSIWK